jgi:hypothetical protein
MKLQSLSLRACHQNAALASALFSLLLLKRELKETVEVFANIFLARCYSFIDVFQSCEKENWLSLTIKNTMWEYSS